MTHLTDVIEETKNEIIRRSNHDATDQWKDPVEVAEYVDQSMTKAALAVVEEFIRISEIEYQKHNPPTQDNILDIYRRDILREILKLKTTLTTPKE